jgi:hypothetical protein
MTPKNATPSRMRKYRTQGGGADWVKVEVLVPAQARAAILEHAKAVRDAHRAAKIKNDRPGSLRAVVRLGLDPEFGLDPALREFLDRFYGETDVGVRSRMLRDEPPLLPGNDRANAYLAAVAEHLARTYGLTNPSWTGKPERFLKRAFFPCGLHSLKATLVKESPPAFRRRMIFVEAEPLFRPRKVDHERLAG